jgi:hypothetical protein
MLKTDQCVQCVFSDKLVMTPGAGSFSLQIVLTTHPPVWVENCPLFLPSTDYMLTCWSEWTSSFCLKVLQSPWGQSPGHVIFGGVWYLYLFVLVPLESCPKYFFPLVIFQIGSCVLPRAGLRLIFLPKPSVSLVPQAYNIMSNCWLR